MIFLKSNIEKNIYGNWLILQAQTIEKLYIEAVKSDTFLEKNTTWTSSKMAEKIKKKSSNGVLEKAKAAPQSDSKKKHCSSEGIMKFTPPTPSSISKNNSFPEVGAVTWILSRVY